MHLRRKSSRPVKSMRQHTVRLNRRKLNTRIRILPSKTDSIQLTPSRLNMSALTQRRRLRLRRITRTRNNLPNNLSRITQLINYHRRHNLNSHPMRRPINRNITMRHNLILTVHNRQMRQLSTTIMSISRAFANRNPGNNPRPIKTNRISVQNRKRAPLTRMPRRQLRSIRRLA